MGTGNIILSEIELNDKQAKAFNEELNKWKEAKKAEITEQVNSELQTEFDVKVRQIEEEKENFKKEQMSLVEEIKTKMQKVMVQRFTNALKDVWDEMKVEARKEVLSDPRIIALEEIKNVVYPLMDETVTKGYVDELAKALQMVENKEEEIDKLKARLKLKEITASMTPVVAEAVEAFVGSATTEEEVVEKYSRLKSLVNEASSVDEAKKKDKDAEEEEDEKDSEEEDEKDEKDSEEEEEDEEDSEEEDDEESDEDEESEEDEDEDKDKKKKGKKEESMDEELEIKPSVHFEKDDEKKQGYLNTLNEMLDLAGLSE